MEPTTFIPADTVPAILQWWHDFEEIHENTQVIMARIDVVSPGVLAVDVKVFPFCPTATEGYVKGLLEKERFVPVGFVGTPNTKHGGGSGYCGTLLPAIEDEASPEVLKVLTNIMDSVLEQLQTASTPLTPEAMRKMDS